MRIALLADEYRPARTSVAVQMHDLAKMVKHLGHEPTVIVPSSRLDSGWSLEALDGVDVLRLKAPRSKDISHVRRAITEFVLPYVMRLGIAASPLAGQRWDGVVWYSPTIFFGPMVRWIKKESGCPSYLILRDLFPDWAVDTGVMGKGPAYYWLKRVERAQYRAADTIGVQTPANLKHLRPWSRNGRKKVEVLYNWLSPVSRPARPFELPAGLEGRIVFVYAGNMGRAQGMDCMIELAAALSDEDRAAFLFVGRGSEVARLKEKAASLGNVFFHDEVEPEEVPGLLERCQIGLLALDPRHTTHNIPGKLLTYLRAGLPVLASVNAGNDIVELIEEHRVGLATTGGATQELVRNGRRLLIDRELRASMGANGVKLSERLFSAERAARQVIAGLEDQVRRA